MIGRYTLPEMGGIWTEENRYRKWLEVEIAACQANAEAGKIPPDAVDAIRRKAAFSVERIHELEKTTDHDVIAFDLRQARCGFPLLLAQPALPDRLLALELLERLP